MTKHPWGRSRRACSYVTLIAVMGAGASACGGSSPSASPTTSQAAAKPTSIYPGPAGLIAGAQPQPDGYMWLLARKNGSANIQELNLTSGHIGLIVPESASADSMAQSSSGLIGVGLATSSTGALELRNGSSGALVGSVPIGAPVKSVFAGSDGSTFYVLNGNRSSSSVTLVNSATEHQSVTIPVPSDTQSIAVDPASQNLYALESSGMVTVITTGTGAVVARFTAGAHSIELAMAPTGQLLYVLKDLGNAANVGVFDIQTETQQRVLAAPANAVGIQVSLDGRSLYAIVGTTTYGNVQVFPAGT